MFTDTVEAYNKLSPAFQQRLHGLNAEHSVEKGGTSIHPLVRTIPQTGEKSLFMSPVCKSNDSFTLALFLSSRPACSQAIPYVIVKAPGKQLYLDLDLRIALNGIHW